MQRSPDKGDGTRNGAPREGAPSSPRDHHSLRPTDLLFELESALLLTLSRDGRILRANAGWSSLLATFGHATPGTLEQTVHPEDRASLRALLERTVAEQNPVLFRHRLAFEGAADSYLEWSLVYDAPRDVVHALGSQYFAEEDREAELRQSLERNRQIIRHAPLGIIYFDTRGTLLEANESLVQMMGTSREKILGMNTLETLENEAVLKGIRNTLQGRSGTFEGWYSSVTGGRRIHVRAWFCPIRQRERITGGIILVEDNTTRVQLEEQVRQATKMEAIGLLAGGVAHDFNNLLTAIAGSTELAMLSAGHDERLHAELSEVLASVDRATDLVRHLLLFSRKQEFELVPVELDAVVLNLEKLLSRLLGEEFQLRIRREDEKLVVEGDAGYIEQLLLNLVVNARDAMEQGGTILVRLRRQRAEKAWCTACQGPFSGHYVVVDVVDQGVGIEPEQLPHIFEPFFTTKEEGRGTGLGLATVYGILQQLKGHLVVESSLGEGTTFSVHLPLSDRPVQSRLDLPGGEDPSWQGDELIVLAEDDAAVRNLAARILEKQGYEVHTALDGRDALELAEELDRPPDLLVSDVVMPRMRGTDLARILRENHPGLPVLLMSGYVGEGRLEGEGDRFLQKPFLQVALLRTVRELLDEAKR